MKRPGFWFCICPDWQLIKDYIDDLLNKFNFKGTYKIFWADEGIKEQYWSCFLQRGLFKDNLILILRRCEFLDNEFWDRLGSVLKKFYLRIWPFFCIETEWKKNKMPTPASLEKQTYWKYALKKGWVWKDQGITPSNVISHFINFAKKLGIYVKLEDVFPIKDFLPMDGYALIQEVKKLKMYLQDKNIATLKDILDVLSPANLDIFYFIDALEKREINKNTLWKDIINRKNEEFLFLLISLLFREIRILWLIKTKNIHSIKIPEFVLKKKSEIVKKISFEDLSRLLSILLDIEFGVKTGLLNPSQAIDFLISSVSITFSSY